MTRTPLGRRFRAAAAGAGIAVASFTMVACGGEEPLDEPAVEELEEEFPEED